MERVKTFGIYALIVIIFFIFSNLMIDIAIKSMYNPINVDLKLEENLKIDINDIKATAVNGYVKGSVSNTGDLVNKKYIKIDLYSERDNLVGTKYVEVNNLQKGEKKEFDIGFKINNVEYAKICTVDNVENATEENFKSDNIGGVALIVAVIFLCFFG